MRRVMREALAGFGWGTLGCAVWLLEAVAAVNPRTVAGAYVLGVMGMVVGFWWWAFKEPGHTWR